MAHTAGAPALAEFQHSRADSFDSPGGCRPWLLLVGLSIAVLMDAVNSTVVSVARAQMMGTTHATPDEIAWINMSYLIVKLIAFLSTARLVERFGSRSILILAIGVTGIASFGCLISSELSWLIGWRIVQGFGGGVLICAGQMSLFASFSRAHQGLAQACFALAIIMCPATIAPALQGWITDTVSWSWIFALNLPVGFAGLFIVCRAVNGHGSPKKPAVRFDIIGLMLLGCSIACLVYVLQEGSRYDWFEEPKILYLTFAGSVTLILLIVWEMWSKNQGALIDSRVFRNSHFTFGFIVSFVAGFALFGSAFIIPLFATNVLDLSPTHAGLLLLPSGALIGFGHLLAGGLIQIKRVPPFKFIPIGVICLMTGMWLLSGSTVDSGAPDMSGALLLRGFGLGLMFVALTIVTLGDLSGSCINHGVGLFNFGRQIGGLIGIAFLQTYLDRQIALNRGVLAQYLTPDAKALSERQDMIIGLLGERGYDAADVASAAIAMLQKSLQTQVAVLSFNEAFLAIALLFVFAAPVLIAIQILQKLTGGRTHAH